MPTVSRWTGQAIANRARSPSCDSTSPPSPRRLQPADPGPRLHPAGVNSPRAPSPVPERPPTPPHRTNTRLPTAKPSRLRHRSDVRAPPARPVSPPRSPAPPRTSATSPSSPPRTDLRRQHRVGRRRSTRNRPTQQHPSTTSTSSAGHARAATAHPLRRRPTGSPHVRRVEPSWRPRSRRASRVPGDSAAARPRRSVVGRRAGAEPSGSISTTARRATGAAPSVRAHARLQAVSARHARATSPARPARLRPARPRTTKGRAEGGSSDEVNRRRPTLPGPCGPSTIGAERLNCSVRNGKRCFPLAIATGNSRELPAAPQNCTARHTGHSDAPKIIKIRQALDPLVPVSFTRYRASRSGLSTWWSTRGLTPSRGWESSSRGRLPA